MGFYERGIRNNLRIIGGYINAFNFSQKMREKSTDYANLAIKINKLIEGNLKEKEGK